MDPCLTFLLTRLKSAKGTQFKFFGGKQWITLHTNERGVALTAHRRHVRTRWKPMHGANRVFDPVRYAPNREGIKV